jgi:hypothetical protein
MHRSLVGRFWIRFGLGLGLAGAVALALILL